MERDAGCRERAGESERSGDEGIPSVGISKSFQGCGRPWRTLQSMRSEGGGILPGDREGQSAVRGEQVCPPSSLKVPQGTV